MTAALHERLRAQARQCGLAGSALNEAVLAGAADDLQAGGPTADVLVPLEHDPPGSVPSLRLAGALHRLVLERRAPALAVHYPSVGGTVGDVWPAARALLATRTAAVQELVRRPVQTNEVGRSSVLLGGLLHAVARYPLPVRLLEIGASAGLNLLVDRFCHHVADGATLGDPASPVQLTDRWLGARPPAGRLHLLSRVGCDPAPLDPASAADRLTLTSYVWADQLERFQRLRAALQVASRHAPAVARQPASAFLAAELATPVPGVLTVVWQSVVRQYLPPQERRGVAAGLESAGHAAAPDAPLVHLAMEADPPGGFAFTLSMTCWPGGATRVLADCQGHGPPVRWR